MIFSIRIGKCWDTAWFHNLQFLFHHQRIANQRALHPGRLHLIITAARALNPNSIVTCVPAVGQWQRKQAQAVTKWPHCKQRPLLVNSRSKQQMKDVSYAGCAEVLQTRASSSLVQSRDESRQWKQFVQSVTAVYRSWHNGVSGLAESCCGWGTEKFGNPEEGESSGVGSLKAATKQRLFEI